MELTIIDLNGLNAPQRVAAETIDGPVLILAGAGSGKTRTITFRIAHMVQYHRINPENILAVSFTNKAAAEMRERTLDLLGKKDGEGLTLTTFHSLGVRILRKEITKLGYSRFFSIYDTSDQMSIIRQALKNFKDRKSFDRKQILSRISYLKTNGISEFKFESSREFDPEDPYDVATEYVYRFYQDKLKFFNAIDFDDILFLTNKLFEENPDVALTYSNKFKYIMIDEYQDTNNMQFKLIMHLTKTHNNLCVVGDDDQAIYAFRGANISNILDFEKNFKNAKIIKLEENYRSTTPILKLANTVIKENKKRKDKTLWSKIASTNLPKLWACGDPEHESQIVIEDIAKKFNNGSSFKEMAILYRSNLQSVPFEDQLRINNIPYIIIGGQKFYEKKEVKDLMAYLQVILNQNDEIALRRILNIPSRGIGNVTLSKYLKMSELKKTSLFKSMEINPGLDPNREKFISPFVKLIRKYQGVFRTGNLANSISSLIEEISYYQFIEKQYDSVKQIDMRKNDVLAFIESAGRFTRQMKKNATLKEFVEKVLLQDSQDNNDEDEEVQQKDEVQMLTLHSSKGLEFDTVYLVGIEEELLPHKRTIIEGEDISEERRLCYVGITRARKNLTMTYCLKRTIYGKELDRHTSRFIHALKDKNLFTEQNRTRFDHLSKEDEADYKKSFFSGLMKNLE